MLRINNIRLKVGDEGKLKGKIANILRIKENEILEFSKAKKSIDARNKNNIYYVYSVDVEVENEKKYENIKNVSIIKEEAYSIKKIDKKIKRPIIIGSGPSGLFSALVLAKAGLNPIIIEQGKTVRERKIDVDKFWDSGKLDLYSNVQFGEGGAGTFSDGKLHTGIKDFRIGYILSEFVKYGAPEEILYMAKPHIGTDKLIITMENMRKEIESLGGEYKFSTRFNNLIIKDNTIQGISLTDLINDKEYELETDICILAIGHSSRDTYRALSNTLEMEQKPFSMGLRIEHSQEMINKSQYGKFYNKLPPAEYTLNARTKDRGIYTFCMCPGGFVVGASSHKNKVVTNGMSYHDRDGINANSALLVNIYTKDYWDKSPLSGIKLQEELEEKAFIIGGENYFAPCQLVGDFLENKETKSFYNTLPTYKPGIKMTNFNDWLPKYINNSLKQGILELDKRLKGFNTYDGVLTGVESRSSSPVRINRDENYNTNIKGVYPIGEGAGYAGGIMSAAVDGVRCGERIINSI